MTLIVASLTAPRRNPKGMPLHRIEFQRVHLPAYGIADVVPDLRQWRILFMRIGFVHRHQSFTKIRIWQGADQRLET
jgi:hypothetical protein